MGRGVSILKAALSEYANDEGEHEPERRDQCFFPAALGKLALVPLLSPPLPRPGILVEVSTPKTQ